jgi:hypothetical protein
MENKNRKIKFGAWSIIFMLCAISMSDCAQPMTPRGGPKDSLPPVVVGAEPAYRTTNFNGKRVVIMFDEYVQLKDQQAQFYMSPFPEKKPTLMIKNRSVVVDLKSPLDSGVTYSLNFGESLVDNNEGNILHGLTYVFSTGGEIDSLKMTGLALDAYTLDSVSLAYVMFYDPESDSLDLDSTLYRSKALAVGRTNRNGIFVREFLKGQPYKVYGFLDKNGNQYYERGVDMVAFTDELFNPTQLPEVSIWEDTSGVQLADAQVVLYLFKEKALTRQNFSEMTRPLKNKIVMKFNAPWPQITELEIDGIDKSKIIYEYLKPERDSMALWLDMPLEDLPDTLNGSFVYMKPDSMNVMIPTTEPIKLGFFEKKEKKQDQDSLKSKKMSVNVHVKGAVLPYENIPLEFAYPLNKVEKNKIELEYCGRGDKWQRVQMSIERDSVNAKLWIISSQWVKGGEYRLMIPAGAFRNIIGEQNDTLKAPFTIASTSEYSTIILNVSGADSNKNYIVQIVDPTQRDLKVLREIKSVGNGVLKIEYVDVGTRAIRVIEDSNKNERWDPGELEHRVAPERVRMLTSNDGVATFLCKKNWDVEFDLDLNKLYAPRKVVKTELLPDSLLQQQTRVDNHNHQHNN